MYNNLSEIYFFYHAHIMDADRIPYLVAAIFLTIVVGMITGPFTGNANPFLWNFFDILFGRFGDRIDRKSRSKKDLILRGFLYVSCLLLCVLLVVPIIHTFTSQNWMVEVLLLSLCLTSGSVWYMILKLYFALSQKGQAKGGYWGLARSSRIDLNSTDDYGITREGLSFAAMSFDKGLIAPTLWYLIGGLPLVMIYSVVAFSAWRFGKQGFSKGFGEIPFALEKFLGFIPSVFSGFLFTASAAISPTAKITKAIQSWWQAMNKVPYEQGGVVLSALAWPLNVSLGGPVQDISGSALKRVWVGPDGATAQIEHVHLKRGIIMHVVAHLFLILALLSAYVYAGKVF